MNKNKFRELIRGYHSLSEKNLEEIDEIIAVYPYVQIGHALSAKANQNIHSPKAGIKLKYAAVYTAERSVLRSLMENKIVLDQPSEPSVPTGSDSESPKSAEQPVTKKVEKIPNEEKPPIAPGEAIDVPEPSKHREMMENLYAEIDANLQELQKYKFQFFEENPDIFQEELQKKKSSQAEVTESEAVEESQSPEVTQVKKEEPEPQVDYLEQLKDKDSDDTSDSKLQEQIKIIDEFIEASTKLANLPPPEDDSNKEDLSKPSTTLGDDLVSENLANIMIKQGKVNDAIDIYKKLIWKFPQKQAYFAARIEELKKN